MSEDRDDLSQSQYFGPDERPAERPLGRRPEPRRAADLSERRRRGRRGFSLNLRRLFGGGTRSGAGAMRDGRELRSDQRPDIGGSPTVLQPERSPGEITPFPSNHIPGSSRGERGAPRRPERWMNRDGARPAARPLPTSQIGAGERRRPQGDPQRAARALQRQQSQAPRRPSKPLSPAMKFGIYGLNLLVVGVGLSVLAGALLSALDPSRRPAPVVKPTASESASPVSSGLMPGQGVKLSQELGPLKTALQGVTAKVNNFLPGVFIVDLDDGSFVNLNADLSFSSASTIKLPILVAFFQEVDAGKIRLDDLMTLKKEHIAEGSGDMQFLAPGTQISALEVATNMIIHSDNSATNLLIERLGGMTALNQRFATWGLSGTKLNNLLPDLSGTNVTTPKELGMLLGRVNQGELLSLGSRDRMLDIMQQTVNDSLLPQSADGNPGVKIAHKTGDIETMLGDVGVLTLPNGKRYIASMMMKRPKNDERATILIHQMARLTYQAFNRPQGTPVNAPLPTIPNPGGPSAPGPGVGTPGAGTPGAGTPGTVEPGAVTPGVLPGGVPGTNDRPTSPSGQPSPEVTTPPIPIPN